MGNSNTEHSRELRKKTSKQRVQRVIEAGGLRMLLILEKPAAQALRDEMQHAGESATAVITRMLLQEKS